MGGIFELQSSIQSKGNLRNLVLFGLMVGVYFGLSFILKMFHQRIGKYLSRMAMVYFLFNAVVIWFCSTVQWSIASNLFVNNLTPGEGLEESLKGKFLSEVSASKAFGESFSGVGSDYNVVLLIVETFDFRVAQNKEVMPFLNSRLKQMSLYEKHYTPWPFSSKSVYSLVCGRYPYPGSVNEMRLLPNKNCNSWVDQLSQKGWRTYGAYTGDFHYDRMGKFFKTQGIKTLEDKHILRELGKYKETLIGVDDLAMVKGLERFISQNPKQKFVSVLVPVNSHHPFWIPDDKFKISDSAYLNSMHYQDFLIEEYFKLFEEKGILNKTIFIITGDHGPRERENSVLGVLPEVNYHVPLAIFHPELNQERGFNFPTSHAQVGGSVLRWLQVGFNDRLTLESKAPVLNYYDFEMWAFQVLTESTATLVIPKEEKTFKGYEWVHDRSLACEGNCQKSKEIVRGHIEDALKNYNELSQQ